MGRRRLSSRRGQRKLGPEGKAVKQQRAGAEYKAVAANAICIAK